MSSRSYPLIGADDIRKTDLPMNEPNHDLHVGLVPYLNVQPLIWAFEQELIPCRTGDGRPMHFEAAVPSVLAERLRRAQCHVAIVPAFEYFGGGRYAILPTGAIATRREVGSVLIVANAPLEQLRRVTLDPASLTSVNLLRVLRAEKKWPFALEEGRRSEEPLRAADWLLTTREPAGQLLIGDPALVAVGRFPYAYDLGSLWYELTQLPFVFAVWLVHPSASECALCEPFGQARILGTSHLEQVAADCARRFGFSPEFALNYFRTNLWFELGESELEGLRTFGQLLHKHGLISHPPALRFHDR